jgi:hypothetical protein
MGKGYLMPDTRTLEDCQIPVFKTHPTPINVSIKPGEHGGSHGKADGVKKKSGGNASALSSSPSESSAVAQGCGCVIL